MACECCRIWRLVHRKPDTRPETGCTLHRSHTGTTAGPDGTQNRVPRHHTERGMDEADEMLNMGFTDSINAILADVPQERNTLLFSATMSPEIARISKKYLRDAKEITIGRKNEAPATWKHVAFCVHAKDKYAALKRIVDYYPQIYGIIFCRTRKETQEIADKLMQEGYNADSLHGELSQAQRDAVMQKFRIRQPTTAGCHGRCRTRPRWWTT